MVTATLPIKALHDGAKHSFNVLIAVDIEDQSPFTIEAQERLGSVGKYLEPVRHDVLCIVDALEVPLCEGESPVTAFAGKAPLSSPAPGSLASESSLGLAPVR